MKRVSLRLDMFSKNEIKTVLIDVIQSLLPNVQAIYLFGSYYKQEIHKESDIDIALLLPHAGKIKSRHFDIVSDLVSRLGVAIDLVSLREVSTVLQFEIVNNSELLFFNDQNIVSEFEMYTYSFYQKLNEDRKDIIEQYMKVGLA